MKNKKDLEGKKSEMLIGQKIPIDDNQKENYLSLMEQIFDHRGIAKYQFILFCKWIEETDFFTAPASTRYHGCFDGGLLEHHIDVYNQMMEFISVEKFSNVDIFSAALCALTHDYCKIGAYEKFSKNVKDDKTGRWSVIDAYRYAENAPIPMGHGIASMWLAQKHIPLSDEEALAIRWHMGEYDVSDYESRDLGAANKKYPLVQMLQFADRLSITEY